MSGIIFPSEIWLRIIAFIDDVNSLVRVSAVCKLWNEISQEQHASITTICANNVSFGKDFVWSDFEFVEWITTVTIGNCSTKITITAHAH
jgi:hypothetical protein